MTIDSLKVLESKVEGVLSRQLALGEERDQLRVDLEAARKQIESISGQLAEAERERAAVKTRVESLLGRLDELNLCGGQ